MNGRYTINIPQPASRVLMGPMRINKQVIFLKIISGSRGALPLILGKKEETTEGRKAGGASKTKAGPPLSSRSESTTAKTLVKVSTVI